jgi:hypothetical protein
MQVVFSMKAIFQSKEFFYEISFHCEQFLQLLFFNASSCFNDFLKKLLLKNVSRFFNESSFSMPIIF